MNTFTLVQRTNTKFQVMNSAGDVCGSISVEPNQVTDLLRCWSGERQPSPKQNNPMVVAMMKLKRRPMNRQAILRGCC